MGVPLMVASIRSVLALGLWIGVDEGRRRAAEEAKMKTRLLASAAIAVALSGVPALAAERSGLVTFAVDVAAPRDAKSVKLWFPYPTSDATQAISNLRFDGNYSTFTLSREPNSGALYLYTEWKGPAEHRTLTVSFHARSRENRVPNLAERAGDLPVEVRKYLESEFWVPVEDPRVKAAAAEATRGRKGHLAKARGVYDWVVENTRRDPNVPGCGLGRVEVTIAQRTGKCADISSVFVAVARAAGVPAREVFGLRLGQPGEADITDGHHCWVEFYLPGTGWVPADPADVRKAMLAKNLDLAAAKPVREFYFGAVDQFRIQLQKGGRGLTFPEGNAEKVNYFMYPYAEVDGKPLDYCMPKSFRYTVSFKED
jgi:transglutaminase-like putative cysteine protease